MNASTVEEADASCHTADSTPCLPDHQLEASSHYLLCTTWLLKYRGKTPMCESICSQHAMLYWAWRTISWKAMIRYRNMSSICTLAQLDTNFQFLAADEPTSGLDSTTAMHLLTTLRQLASGGRAVVTTIHQPSSRLYMQLDKLLLLSEGHVMYYGELLC